MPDPDKLLTTIRRATELFRATPGRAGGIVAPETIDDVIVAGDLHGNIPAFKKVLDIAALAQHPRRHLVLQELIHGNRFYSEDRGDRSHQLVDLLAALKCQYPDRIHLILGNHDYADRVNKATLWQGIRELKELKVGETKIVLCHYALRTWNGSHRGALQLHGHSHGGLAGDSQSLDVGVDCWDFRPVTLDEIKERLATMPKRVELDHHRPSE